MASPSSSSKPLSRNNSSRPSLILLTLLIAVIFVSSAVDTAAAVSTGHLPVNQTFQPAQQLRRLKRVNAHLKKINKPAVRTIQAMILNVFSFLVQWPS